MYFWKHRMPYEQYFHKKIQQADMYKLSLEEEEIEDSVTHEILHFDIKAERYAWIALLNGVILILHMWKVSYIS